MFPDAAIKVAPRFKLGDAIRAPATAKKLYYQRAQREHVLTADEAAGCVVQFKIGSDGADRQNAVFNARLKQLGDGALADSKPLLLHKVARVSGDLVELVLKCGHLCSVIRSVNSAFRNRTPGRLLVA